MFEFILGGSGTPLVRVTIVENGAGSFTFTLTQIGSGTDGAWQNGDLKGEIRGLFFDVDGNATNLSLTGITLEEGRTYSTLTGAVTTGGAGQNDVTGFTKTNSDVNMNGAGLPDDGGYDVGVAIGTSGVGAKGDDVQGVSFTLTGLTGIDLEDFANQDFGLRMMSIGTVNADEAFISSRDGSAKIVGDSGDIATNEAPEATPVSTSGDEDATYIPVTLTGTDSDGTVATVRLTSLPTDGVLYTDLGLTIPAATGVDYAGSSVTFYFVPDANFNGEVNFDFTVTDNDGASDATPATATITVDAVNDAPQGTDNTVATDEDTAYVFTAADFGFSDPVEGDDLLAVKITTLPINGALLLSGSPVSAGDFVSAADIIAGNLTFAPAANANGAGYASFTFQVQDDGGTANGGTDLDQSANTITINVDAVNDAPAGTDKTVTTDEDTAYVFSVSDFGFSDPVEGDDLLAVKVSTLPAAGSLLLNGSPVSAGDFVSAADITAGNLTFAPAANANGAGYASFTFQVQDNGGTDNGGVDLDQSANTLTVNVNAVNDAPAGADNAVTTDEDTAYVFTATDFGFTDPVEGDDLLAVKITTLPTNGSLLLNGLAVSAGDFIAVADINDGNLTFAPAANANGAPYSDFTFQVQDDGGTANGGVDLDQSANTLTVNVNAVNDAPSGADNTVTTNEDTPYTFTAVDFGFSDPIEGDELLAVKITTLPTNGTLKLDGNAVSAGDFVAVADINDGKLTFEPGANANGAPYSDFTFQVQDDGGTANGGVDLDQSANTLTVNVNAVNDAPAGADNAVTTNEDTAYVFTATDFGFTDPVEGDDLLAVKITTLPTNGSLLLNGLAVSAGDFIAVADINDGNLTFAPAANANGAPYSDFTFQVQDDGGTANGGVDLDQTPNTITVNVNAVNDAPEGTNNTVVTNEDTAYVFTAADFGFSDPVEGDSLLAVKISTLPVNGSLLLNGLAVSAGDFIAVADINDGKLTFAPAANANGDGYAGFTFQVQDDGGTDNGGVDLDQSANTLTIDVISVNDEPAGANNTVTTNEDTAYVFVATDFGFTDPDDSPANNLAAVKISTLPLAGVLKLDGLAVAAGDFIAVADINDGKLTFTPAANANGDDYASFTFQVQDDGGTANGGVNLDQSANTLTIDVTAVNDAPVNSVPGAQSVKEDTSLTFTGLNTISVSDVDVGSGKLEVSLSVGNGSLALTTIAGLTFSDSDGSDGTLKFQGSQANINAALATLSYTGASNFNGTDTLTVLTNDLGNTGIDPGLTDGPGAEQDSDSVVITVTPVNDAPGAAADTLYVSNNTKSIVIPISMLLANDTDIDGLAIAISGVSDATGGVSNVVLNAASGTITFDSGNAASGTFKYTITDNNGGTSTALVTVNIPDTNGSKTIDLSSSVYQGSYIQGGSNQDTFTGGVSADILIGGNAIDTLVGGAGDDILRGGKGNDIINGGISGVDLIDFSDVGGGFTFTLGAGGSGTATINETDTYSNIDGVIGGAGKDIITGNTDDNVIRGGDGNDTLDGGAGTDLLDFSDGTSGVTFTLVQSGANTVGPDLSAAGLGTDTYKNFEGVIGTSSADTLTGSDSNDVIRGGEGNDTISGKDGDDVITGGLGADLLAGNAGSDTFVYRTLVDGKDSISDFDVNSPGSGGDKLDISAVLDLGGNTWIDGSSFTDAVNGGYLSFTDDGGKIQVLVDIDGSAGSASSPTLMAVLTNVTFVSATDAANTLNDNIVLG